VWNHDCQQAKDDTPFMKLLNVTAVTPLLKSDPHGFTVDISSRQFNPKTVLQIPDTDFWRAQIRAGYFVLVSETQTKATVIPPPRPPESPAIPVQTQIHDHQLFCRLAKPLATLPAQLIWVNYDRPVSLPPSILNFFFGYLLMEHAIWGATDLRFDCLTETQQTILNLHLKFVAQMLHLKPVQIHAANIVDPEPFPPGQMIYACNGGGKDGLTLSLLLRELRQDFCGFTLAYNHDWPDRYANLCKFYTRFNIRHTIAETNLNAVKFWEIPWWLYALPLNPAAVLIGASIGETKVQLNSKLPFWPKPSFFALTQLSQLLNVPFADPFWSLSDFGVQKLLLTRYRPAFEYQGSCMHAAKSCFRCGKCGRTELYLRALNIVPTLQELPGVCTRELNSDVLRDLATTDVIYELLKKISGKPYYDWFEKMNTHALNLSWRPDLITPILREHFVEYAYDPPADENKNQNLPSQWLKLLEQVWHV
jgi:hypothetical protein